MLKSVKKMKIILILGLGIAMSFGAAMSAMADTITISSSIGGLVYYDREYNGTVGATLDATAISGGIACVDIAKSTSLGAVIPVNVSTLPSNMTNARFGADTVAIVKYEEAAWLLGQMPSNPTQIGEIQFAMWRIFTPDYAFYSDPDRNKPLEDSWLAQALAINPQSYDFSSVRIYTPFPGDNTNQEFMSGGAIYLPPTGNPTPIPASFVLLGSGLLALGILSRRKKAALVRGDKK